MYMPTVFGYPRSFVYVYNTGMGLSIRHSYIGSYPEK